MPKPEPQEPDVEPDIEPPEVPLHELLIQESGQRGRADEIRGHIGVVIAEIEHFGVIATKEDKARVAGTIKALLELQKQLQSVRADVVAHCEVKTLSVRAHFDGLLSHVKKLRHKLKAEIV